MSLIRFIWRFSRLLAHTLRGGWISLSLGNRPDPQIISDWSRKLLEILGIQIHCHGEPPDGPVLIVANHLSWLDIPAISACSHAAFLSKQSIRYWPVVGWFAHASGTIFIRRGKGEASEVAAAIGQRLRENRQFAIFPEGRIGDGREVRRFFPRLFAAAIDTQTPVLPVALRYRRHGQPDDTVIYSLDRTFLGILFHLLARDGSEVELYFCDPIDPEGKDRRGLAREAREAILAALNGTSDGA